MNETLETLRSRSPLMCKVSLEQVRRARGLSLAEALRIARAIAEGAPLAVQAAKKVMMANSGAATAFGYQLSLEALRRIQETEDAKEGPRAFAEKRAPVWKGR